MWSHDRFRCFNISSVECVRSDRSGCSSQPLHFHLFSFITAWWAFLPTYCHPPHPSCCHLLPPPLYLIYCGWSGAVADAPPLLAASHHFCQSHLITFSISLWLPPCSFVYTQRGGSDDADAALMSRLSLRTLRLIVPACFTHNEDDRNSPGQLTTPPRPD